MADGMEHPDEATWERLAHGEVAAPARDALFDHILGCERCSRIWRGVLTLQSEAQAEGLIPHDAPAPARTTWLRSPALQLALAATLVIVVGGLVLNRRSAPETAPAAAPTVTSAPAAPVAPATPASWLAAFPLTKADIHVTPEEALAPRGAPMPSGEPPIDRLATALEPYRRDDFVEAASSLDRLLREFPAASRPALYLGVSLLHLNRDTDAVAPLRIATGSTQPEVAADARWYLSVALARTNQAETAAAQLGQLCSAGGPDAVRACAALKALQESRP